MGQCYTVSLEARFKEGCRPQAADTLRTFIANHGPDGRTGFSPDSKREEGIGTEGLNDLLLQIFTGPASFYSMRLENGCTHLRSAFDASYGWMEVMEKAFGMLTPLLKDGSSLLVEGDSELSDSRVSNGCHTICIKELYPDKDT